jgi:predicted enzyme related to lactoylglutathione lyase
VAYWGVADIRAQVERLNGLGARQNSEVVDVGEGILMATFLDPYGNIFGLIENPHFKAE